MSRENLLKFANDKKPADFTKEFKTILDQEIKSKLFPQKEKQEKEEIGEKDE